MAWIGKNVIIGFALGILWVMSASCQGALSTHHGNVVKEELRVALEKDGAGDGAWETRDVLLKYQFKEAGGRVALSGEVRIADHLRNSFAVLEYFSLTLFFIDADGRVIDSQRFALGPSRKDVWEMSFKKSVDAPESAKAIAFGYSGKATSFNIWDFRSFSRTPFE